MNPTFICIVIALAISSIASGQDWAKARLDKSPRHSEWVKIKQGGRTLNCFVVYPEVKDKATSVLVIHEIFGLTDWARSAADALAEAGYIAIAPDLLSGQGPGGGGTAEMGGNDAAIKAVSALPPDQVAADLKAAAGYVTKLPSASGKLVVAGFCWGGGQAFRFASQDQELRAAFVFYGPPPAGDALARIHCPVYGFYGENDNRITSTVAKTTDEMKRAGKTYEPVIYPGAGHGFMRGGESPDAKPADKQAHDQAWERLKKLLLKI